MAIKRITDVVLAACLIAGLAVPMFVIAAMIRLNSTGPALFRQQRWGRDGKPFTILKFRTLREGEPDPTARYETVETDPRITRIGAVLRKLSLDELPQLFNVISGSMSLVGPRPLVEWESREAAASHPERFQMKPGLTGLTQVSGRNSLSAKERLACDVRYVRCWSLQLDFQIMFRTPLALMSFGGVYPGDASDGTP